MTGSFGPAPLVGGQDLHAFVCRNFVNDADAVEMVKLVQEDTGGKSLETVLVEVAMLVEVSPLDGIGPRHGHTGAGKRKAALYLGYFVLAHVADLRVNVNTDYVRLDLDGKDSLKHA